MRRALEIVARVTRLFGATLFAPVVLLMPRNPRKIVFGAWMGRQYSCNPKYLCEALAKTENFTCVWVGEAALREKVLATTNVAFAAKGSWAALFHVLTAKFFAYNVNWREDIGNVPRCGRVQLLYLTHGYADKNVGTKQFHGKGDESKAKAPLQGLRDFLMAWENWLYGTKAWCSESSEQGIQIRLSNQAFIMSPETMLRFGKPRADYFIAHKNDAEEKRRQRQKIAALLHLPVDKKWYLYVPTWRHDAKQAFSFATTERRAELGRALSDQDAIIIEKQHPLMLRDMSVAEGLVDGVCLVSNKQSEQLDTQELLMACDRMITDYSSVYYDFVLLDRPVIHFAYDFDHFMNVDMGFNYDMREYGGGPFVYTFDELVRCMAQSDAELLAARSAKTLTQLQFETGHACEGYAKLIEGGCR